LFLQAQEDATSGRARDLDREYKKVSGEVNALRVALDAQGAETAAAKRLHADTEAQLSKVHVPHASTRWDACCVVSL
jgi:hypothetical protein